MHHPALWMEASLWRSTIPDSSRPRCLLSINSNTWCQINPYARPPVNFVYILSCVPPQHAPFHKARIVTEILVSYIICETLEQLDMVPCDFHFFPKIKEHLWRKDFNQKKIFNLPKQMNRWLNKVSKFTTSDTWRQEIDGASILVVLGWIVHKIKILCVQFHVIYSENYYFLQDTGTLICWTAGK